MSQPKLEPLAAYVPETDRAGRLAVLRDAMLKAMGGPDTKVRLTMVADPKWVDNRTDRGRHARTGGRPVRREILGP